MTVLSAVRGAFDWASAQAFWILLIAVALPLVGTIAAGLGKLGKTQEDGKQIASVVMIVAVLCVVAELLLLTLAHNVLGVTFLAMDLRLLAAPLVCLGGTIVGLRLVFPLSAIGSVKTMVDLVIFAAALLGVVWLFSRFHWGVYFIGSIGQLVAVVTLAVVFLRRLYRRSFPDPQRARASSAS